MPAISVTYNLPPHLAKFLKSNLGHPYTLRQNDELFSRYIMRSLTGKSTLAAPKGPDGGKKENYTIIIPEFINNQHNKWSISEETQKDFILEAEKIFEAMLFTYIQAYQDIYGQLKIESTHRDHNRRICTIKNAIVHFCDRHNISEGDIALDALKKRYQRNSAKAQFVKPDRNLVTRNMS
jgi:hypothetical protein